MSRIEKISKLPLPFDIILALKSKFKYFVCCSGDSKYLDFLTLLILECYNNPLLSGNFYSENLEALLFSTVSEDTFSIFRSIKTSSDIVTSLNIAYQNEMFIGEIGASLLSFTSEENLSLEEYGKFAKEFNFDAFIFGIIDGLEATCMIKCGSKAILYGLDYMENLYFLITHEMAASRILKNTKNIDAIREVTFEEKKVPEKKEDDKIKCGFSTDSDDCVYCQKYNSQLMAVPCGHRYCFTGYFLSVLERKKLRKGNNGCFKCKADINENYFKEFEANLKELKVFKGCCLGCFQIVEDQFQVAANENPCTHFCKNCILEYTLDRQCLICSYEYDIEEISRLKKIKITCDACKKDKKNYKIIPFNICKCVSKVCLKCAFNAKDVKKCFCGKILKESYIKILNSFLFKTCLFDDKEYARTIKLEGKNCDCKVCNDCQIAYSLTDCVCETAFPEKISQKLFELKKQSESLIEVNTIICPICLREFTASTKEQIPCKHLFCQDCYEQNTICALEQSDPAKALKCMQCSVPFHSYLLQTLVKKDTFVSLCELLINKHMKIITCPKCQALGLTENQSSICESCKFVMCSYCLQHWEKGHVCEDFISQCVSELELTREKFSQCPECRVPYKKDENCDIVICVHCETKFCFSCGCRMVPVLVHGNYYHKADCCHYDRNISEEGKNSFKYDEKCNMCIKTGELCKPPEIVPNKEIKIDDGV